MATRVERARAPLGQWLSSTRRDLADQAGRRPVARPANYMILLGVVVVLDLIGLVMVLSASSVQALRVYGSSWLFFQRQLMWVSLGLAAMVLAARIDYRVWRRFTIPLLLGSVVLLGLVLVPGLGVTVNGSTRWLGAGQWRVQPSELAKLAVLVFAAGLLARRAGQVTDHRRTTRPLLIVLGVFAGMVMLQPDMGTTLVLGCIALCLMFVAGTPVRTVVGLLGAAAGVAFLAGMAAPYRRARLTSFLDPWKDPGNTGYQSIQALVGMGSGGISGLGLGASRAKWGFLPNAHTDFIFAILGEEVGLLGSLAVVALFATFAVVAVRTAAKAPDRFGTLLAAGVAAWVVAQAFINMGAVVGILPVTGVPLPFVSFGGSSLVVMMFGVGILLNVARQGR
jgi:cell division protein FtsW